MTAVVAMMKGQHPARTAVGATIALAAVWLVAIQPADVKVLGLTIGLLYALLSLGFVLVYRSTRVLNMAHGDIGGFGALLLVAVVSRLHFGFWPALLIALAAGVGVGALVEHAFVQRLRDAPRLVVLVVTLGIAQIITATNGLLLNPQEQARLLSTGGFPQPFSWTPRVFGATFRPAAVLTIVLVPLVTAGLAAFLRYHRFGVAMRAAAENKDNARLLGVSVRNVSLTAWMIAGGLSALAAVLIGGASGTSVELGVGPALLVRALAGAMLARLSSLPKAAAWGLAVGLVEQSALFQFSGLRAISTTGLVDAGLFVLIVVALLTQARRSGRSGELDQSSWPVASALRTLPRSILQGTANRRLTRGVVAAVFAMVAVAPAVLSNAHTFLLMQVAAYAIAGLSLVVLTGYGGQISLGQWAIAGIGGFVAGRADTAWGWSPWVTMLLAVLVGAVTALAVGLPALRLRGLLLAVTTLAFAVAASGFLFGAPWFTGGQGLRVDRPAAASSDDAFYYLAMGLVALAVLCVRQVGRGRIGRHITAVRENERAAAAMGLNVVATKLITFAIAGGIAGAAGWVLVYGQGLGNRESFAPALSLTVVALTVLGGIGSVAGPLVGAFLVIGVPRLLPGQAFLATLGTSIGVLQVLLHLPAGLVSVFARLRDLLIVGPRLEPAAVVDDAASPGAAVDGLAAPGTSAERLQVAG